MSAFFSLFARARRDLRVTAILAGVAIIATWTANTVAKSASARTSSGTESQPTFRDEGSMPDFGGATGWLNSSPLKGKSL